MPPMGKLTIAIDCDQCGFSNGTPASNNSTRCLSCGRFVSMDSDACCVRHEIRDSPYPSGACPRCEQERDRRHQRMHEMTRDPTVEPY